jgi:LysR family glycine cleavage system transcriptional activator
VNRRIAPLNALRAFEVTARRLSITDAATELGVTPGAVSQSVKALEGYLGRTLFVRTAKGLILTPVGEAALPALRDGFDKLADATERLAGPERGGRLTVSVAPSFAAKWLAPRMADFAADHADTDVQIQAAMSLTRFDDEGVDLAVRYGAGKWPGLESHLLLRETVMPVCAPAIAATLKSPDDLARHTLLHDDSSLADESCPDWPMWLRAAGAKGVDGARGPRFNQSNLAIEAAAAGKGIALAKRALAQADLETGRLAAPYGAGAAVEFAYWLVYPKSRARSRAARAFINWISAAAKTYEDSIARDVSWTSSAL